MRHRLIVTILTATTLTAAAVGATAASAAPVTPAPRACAVTVVSLHGRNPATVTCAQRVIPGQSSPDLYVTSCYNVTTLDIYDYAGHETCFNGTGYAAIRIIGVAVIASDYNGWVRMYPHGSDAGWFESFSANRNHDYPRNRDITQECVDC